VNIVTVITVYFFYHELTLSYMSIQNYWTTTVGKFWVFYWPSPWISTISSM